MLFFFKHAVFFFWGGGWGKKHDKKAHVLFTVEKPKQTLLLKNCKCFFKKGKIVLSAYFLQKRLPHPPGYESGFISANFDNFLINGDHSLFAI